MFGVCLLLVYRMPYVEATILEVMRYKSVIPMLMRITSQDTEFGGYFISCGTTVPHLVINV